MVVEDLIDEINEAATQVRLEIVWFEEVTGEKMNNIENSKRAKTEKRKQLSESDVTWRFYFTAYLNLDMLLQTNFRETLQRDNCKKEGSSILF